MTKKLKGSSSLSIDNMPKPLSFEERLGLINHSNTFVYKTFRVSNVAAATLEELTERLRLESRIKLSMGKVLELAIFNAENMPIDELMKNIK